MKHRKERPRTVYHTREVRTADGMEGTWQGVLYVEATNLSTVVCALPNLFLELVL
jgi:hypothetical protein